MVRLSQTICFPAVLRTEDLALKFEEDLALKFGE